MNRLLRSKRNREIGKAEWRSPDRLAHDPTWNLVRMSRRRISARYRKIEGRHLSRPGIESTLSDQRSAKQAWILVGMLSRRSSPWDREIIGRDLSGDRVKRALSNQRSNEQVGRRRGMDRLPLWIIPWSGRNPENIGHSVPTLARRR